MRSIRPFLVLVLTLGALAADQRPADAVAFSARPITVSAAKIPFASRGFGLLRDLAVKQPTGAVASFTVNRPHSLTPLATLTVYASGYRATSGAKTLRDRPGYFITGHAYRVANVVLYMGTRTSTLGAPLLSALGELGKPVRLW